MNDLQLVMVSGKDALAELERLRDQWESSGLYPILLGDDYEKELVFEIAEDGDDPAETIEYSLKIDAVKWLHKQRELDADAYAADEGVWPGKVAPIEIITHLDTRSGKPLNEVIIALLSLKAPWEAFAHLRWGNWNGVPEAAVHCAMHRYWGEQYGAQVVSITGSTVQCEVARPPNDRTTSLALARDQYVYCGDIVDQGMGTIAALAASLVNSKYWYFWWD